MSTPLPLPPSCTREELYIRSVAGAAVDEIVEAVGFHDGKVVAVGNKGDVISKMNSVAISYTICELSKGQALLPI